MSTVDVQLSFSRTRNIVGGATGSIPYQTANSSTVFIPIGGNGTILQSNGSTATWVALGGLTAGVASQITTIQRTTNASHFLTFVDSDNSSATAETVYTTSSFVINPSTGNIGIGTTSPAYGKVQINASALGNNALLSLSTMDGTYNPRAIISHITSTTSQYVSFDSSFSTGAGFANWAFASGNVGIGTTSPATQLDIRSTSTGVAAQIKSTFNNAYLYIDRQDLSSNSAIYFRVAGTDGSYIGQLSSTPQSTLTFGTGGTERMRIFSNGNIAINTTTDSSFRLEVNGSFAATTKSFVINHPTKPGMRLRYGSLEGPENGIYVRGKLSGSNVIELPDYWVKLVNPESITVNLTPIGRHQNLYVESIADNKVIIGNSNLLNKDINCFYIVFAERRDVEKLQVEIY